MVKAESDIAVAAASVLARATFVQKMKQMELAFGCNFPKGCNNIVKDAAAEFIKKHGKERLIEVCKAHFKTYKEILVIAPANKVTKDGNNLKFFICKLRWLLDN